jgi:hypothetical protein
MYVDTRNDDKTLFYVLDPLSGMLGVVLDPLSGMLGIVLDPLSGMLGNVLDSFGNARNVLVPFGIMPGIYINLTVTIR